MIDAAPAPVESGSSAAGPVVPARPGVWASDAALAVADSTSFHEILVVALTWKFTFTSWGIQEIKRNVRAVPFRRFPFANDPETA
jgi:hypothetical protein